MCNAKHLLTTALNVLKMIKQEGNFSQQALTDGFSNNERPFGAACGWERVGRWLRRTLLGLAGSWVRATGVMGSGWGCGPVGASPRMGLGGRKGARCLPDVIFWPVPAVRWERAMGRGQVAAPGTPPAGPDPSSPHPLVGKWGGRIALGPAMKQGEAAPEGAEGVTVMDVTENRL